MSSALPWFAIAVATTLITGAALGYIAWREGNSALKQWAVAWMFWAAAGASLAIIGEHPAHPIAAVLCGLAWVASALFFLRGTHLFAGRGLPRAWYLVAAGAAVLGLSLGVGPAGPAGMLPLMLFQSVALITTGILLIRSERSHTGAWLAGLALALLGLHVLDAPLLAPRPDWMPWGFVLAVSLEIVAALGMLMLYYEHARARLLETRRALEDVRRLETLGRVAGGVAHDFNNVLTIMSGHLGLIRMHEPARQSDDLDAIESAVAQAARLTQQLLAFGQRSFVREETVDVEEVVENSLALLATLIPEPISVRFTCAPGVYAARVDRGLLEQIVLNLVTNARDAISGKGEIQVHLGRTATTPPSLRLSVEDDGTGMDEETRSHIFEPFFTTKDTGRGTGLGLSSVHGAVSQLGGTIEVESTPGHGTRFEVTLPWRPPRPSATPAPVAPERRSLDVLIVDDEIRVRGVVRKMLEVGGHRVREAENGRVALARLAERPADVVLCDVVMPEMGGPELAERIAARHPNALVVLTSGHPLDGRLDPRRVAFLPKPFEPEELLERLQQLTAEGLRGLEPVRSLEPRSDVPR